MKGCVIISPILPCVKLDPLVEGLRFAGPPCGHGLVGDGGGAVVDLGCDDVVVEGPLGLEAVEAADADQEGLVDGDGLLGS